MDTEQLVGAAVTRTTGGDIVGTRYTYLDPRQNKTVTWTAYYVSTNPLAWYVHLSGFKEKGENEVVNFHPKIKILFYVEGWKSWQCDHWESNPDL